MTATRRTVATALLTAGLAGPALARAAAKGSGYAGATLLIVRHAEKPESGTGLTPAGEHRAKAYAGYFKHFELDGSAVHVDAVVAAGDTDKSVRSRLTLEPFAKASGLPLQQPFDDKETRAFADWLGQQPGGRVTLIAWHHSQIPNLLAALGADPGSLLPGGEWPSSIFSWVVVLRYDATGRLALQRVVHEPDGLET